ncbi:MAG: WD40 repeat domain-containing protein [bacterium]|nr:WD40 repeat domain-containing protein [bacterium]
MELLWEEEIEILNGYGNRALAWSEDGKRFAAARGEKGLTLGDVMGEEVRLQSLDLKVFSVDYVPQVDSVLVGLLGGAVGRVDGSGSHEEVEALRMPNNIWGIAFSPRGDRVAVTNYQNPGALLRVWAWGPQGPHELLREEQVPEGKTNPSCAWSPDGWILAWCPGPWVEDIITNDVYLLSPEATRCVSAAHKNVISGLSFSPDGDYLVTASWDRTLVLRDARTAEAIASPWSCAQRLHTSVFHPHAALLAAGGTEELGVCFKQPSRLYLLRFSQEEHPQIEVVQEHATDSAVCSVAFSPNGEQLLMMTKNHLSLFRVHLI